MPNEHKLGDVIHNGMTVKIQIPVGECDAIEQFVDTTVSVDVESIRISGTLLKVSTIKKKEGGEVIAILKQLDVEVESISGIDEEFASVAVSFPGRKENYAETVTVTTWS